jgi:hypothetical protein
LRLQDINVIIDIDNGAGKAEDRRESGLPPLYFWYWTANHTNVYGVFMQSTTFPKVNSDHSNGHNFVNVRVVPVPEGRS